MEPITSNYHHARPRLSPRYDFLLAITPHPVSSLHKPPQASTFLLCNPTRDPVYINRICKFLRMIHYKNWFCGTPSAYDPCVILLHIRIGGIGIVSLRVTWVQMLSLSPFAFNDFFLSASPWSNLIHSSQAIHTSMLPRLYFPSNCHTYRLTFELFTLLTLWTVNSLNSLFYSSEPL